MDEKEKIKELTTRLLVCCFKGDEFSNEEIVDAVENLSAMVLCDVIGEEFFDEDVNTFTENVKKKINSLKAVRKENEESKSEE